MKRLLLLSGLLVWAALAHADPPFIPNVPVSDDTTSGNQNETTIAGFGRSFLCGGWNDDRASGLYHVGFSYSTNAGATWSKDTLLHGLDYAEDGDPVLGVDDSGKVYYFFINFDRNSNVGNVDMAKSHTGGRTWDTIVNITPNTPNTLNDKPWAAIDGNNIFFTCTEFGGTNMIRFRRSPDRGATWTSPVSVGDNGNGSFPFRGADSTVYVGWGFQDIRLNRSTDMGRTWQGAQTIIPVTWSPPSAPWRLNNVPSFGTSRDHTRLYVAFADSRLNSNQLDVFFSSSSDSGQTWSTPVKINDTPSGDTTQQFYPWLAVEPSNRIHAVWYDTRAGGGRIAEYHSYSSDFGATWSANQRVSDTAVYANTFIGDYQSCAADSWRVHALWCEARTDPGNPDVFYSHASLVPSHDVGCTRIIAPSGIVDSGAVVAPACSVRNYGTYTETYTVRMRIGSTYNDTARITGHAPGTQAYLTFPNYTASARGTSAVSCSTELSNDNNPANDRIIDSVTVAVHDVGTVAILAPLDTVDSGAAVVPIGLVRNFGTATEHFMVRFRIGGQYYPTDTVNLPAGGIDTVRFPAWTPTRVATYPTSCSTMLAHDNKRSNDAIRDSVRVKAPGSVAETPTALPLRFMLGNASPNPFSVGCAIRYGLPRESRVALRIYSATGRLVRAIENDRQPAGYYLLAWDGRDDMHRVMGHGVYYCLLDAGATAAPATKFRAVRKLIKLD